VFAERGDNCAVAALGTTLEIQTIGGDATRIKIPAGTQHGAKLRIREKGMPKLHGRGRGDLIVQVRIDVPKELTARQKELVEELARSLDENAHNTGQSEGIFKKIFGKE
jgi:molecular chaperone DnaJ